MSHATALIDLIQKNKSQRVIEIGIHTSSLTKSILRNKECFSIIKEYWAVDPFKKWTEMRGSQEQWDQFYMNACGLAKWFPQHHVIRVLSHEAVTLFPDEYFDLIYIDADHRYDIVKHDIQMWLPKVKSGGIISGHDYYDPIKDARHPGVAKAVNELFGKPEVLEGVVWIKRVARSRGK